MTLQSLRKKLSSISGYLLRENTESIRVEPDTNEIDLDQRRIESEERMESRRGEMNERGGTAPDGQVLADWMTYLSYVTTINDMAYTVETIANLPLTYYGPSIPLGDGWTYGGLTPPTGEGEIPFATATATTITTASVGSSRSEIPPHTETGQSTVMGGSASPASTSPTASSVTATKSASAIISSATVASISFSPSEGTASSSAISSSSSSSTSSPSASLSASSSSSSNELAPSASASSTPDSEAGTEGGRNLLAPLLAALLPLGIIVLLVLLSFCVYHKNRHSRDSGFFGAFHRPLKASSDSTPKHKQGASLTTSQAPLPPTSPGAKSPDEKSALLPGFIAQHHRSSSSLSVDRVNNDRIVADGAANADDELRDLVKNNQSLLQRLTLGVGAGWMTPSSSVVSGSSQRKDRKASGDTLEKGNGGRRIFSSEASATAAGVLGWGRKKDNASSGSGDCSDGGARGSRPGGNASSTNSSGNNGYERVLDDDQLFYIPPKTQTQSSSGSRTGSVTGSPSIPTTVGTGPKRNSGQRTPNLPVREEGEGERSHNENEDGSRTFSIGAPQTPGTGNGTFDLERDLGAGVWEGRELKGESGGGDARWDSARWSEGGERMRFPVPPGLGLYGDGTFGSQRDREREEEQATGPDLDAGGRESYMSAETAYYSAISQSSNDHRPSTPPPPSAQATGGIPLTRDSEGYRHASVSAFGSHPPTPTRPRQPSSNDHSSFTHQYQAHAHAQYAQDGSLIIARKGSIVAQASSPLPGWSRDRSDRERTRMSELFSSTPTPEPHSLESRSSPADLAGVRARMESGTGGTGGSGDSEGDKRRSYVGQPMIDASLRSTHYTRGVGEFGEPLRRAQLLAPVPTLIPSPLSPHSSQSGSLHLSAVGTNTTQSSGSYYSHATSGGGGGSGVGSGSGSGSVGSHCGDASEASHEQVLRGQRSKGRLVRASSIGAGLIGGGGDLKMTPGVDRTFDAGASGGMEMMEMRDDGAVDGAALGKAAASGTQRGADGIQRGRGGRADSSSEQGSSVEVIKDKGGMVGKGWVGRWRGYQH